MFYRKGRAGEDDPNPWAHPADCWANPRRAGSPFSFLYFSTSFLSKSLPRRFTIYNSIKNILIYFYFYYFANPRRAGLPCTIISIMLCRIFMILWMLCRIFHNPRMESSFQLLTIMDCDNCFIRLDVFWHYYIPLVLWWFSYSHSCHWRD